MAVVLEGVISLFLNSFKITATLRQIRCSLRPSSSVTSDEKDFQIYTCQHRHRFWTSLKTLRSRKPIWKPSDLKAFVTLSSSLLLTKNRRRKNWDHKGLAFLASGIWTSKFYGHQLDLVTIIGEDRPSSNNQWLTIRWVWWTMNHKYVNKKP